MNKAQLPHPLDCEKEYLTICANAPLNSIITFNDINIILIYDVHYFHTNNLGIRIFGVDQLNSKADQIIKKKKKGHYPLLVL